MSITTKLLPLAETYLSEAFPSLRLVNVPIIGLFRLPLVGFILQFFLLLLEIGVAISIIILANLGEQVAQVTIVSAIIVEAIMGSLLYFGIIGMIVQSAVDAVGDSDKQEKVIRYQLGFSLYNLIRWTILVLSFYSNMPWAVFVAISFDACLLAASVVVLFAILFYECGVLCKEKIQSELAQNKNENQKLIV